MFNFLHFLFTYFATLQYDWMDKAIFCESTIFVGTVPGWQTVILLQRWDLAPRSRDPREMGTSPNNRGREPTPQISSLTICHRHLLMKNSGKGCTIKKFMGWDVLPEFLDHHLLEFFFFILLYSIPFYSNMFKDTILPQNFFSIPPTHRISNCLRPPYADY